LKRTISPTLNIGKTNFLRVSEESEYGIYLEAEDGSRVLLPNRYTTDDMEIGSIVEVFVYHDSEDRVVATTDRPKAELGEVAIFEVIDTNHYGAFVDWGLPKDLFVPLSQQKEHFRVGDRKLLRVSLDERSGRVYATQRIGKFFERDMKGLKPKQECKLFVIAKTPMGYKVLVDSRYEGMIYHNEIFQDISIGDTLTGYIKKVREDRKLDITLSNPNKSAKIENDTERFLEILQKTPIYDGYKLSPDRCKEIFGLSRKAYKRVLTKLIEEGRISIKDGEIKVIKT